MVGGGGRGGERPARGGRKSGGDKEKRRGDASKRDRAAEEAAAGRLAEARRREDAAAARAAEGAFELDEVRAAMLEEAVGVVSLSVELRDAEASDDERRAELERADEAAAAAAAREAALKVRLGETADALRDRDAELAEARRETAAARASAEHVHALCDAFDVQLGSMSANLAEREVIVCVLLAELRALDLAADLAAVPHSAPRARARRIDAAADDRRADDGPRRRTKLLRRE